MMKFKGIIVLIIISILLCIFLGYFNFSEGMTNDRGEAITSAQHPLIVSDPNPASNSTSVPYSSNENARTNNGSVIAYSGSDGIPASQIPSGDKDLYILKTDIVPPPFNQQQSCPSVHKDKSECGVCPKVMPCPRPAYSCKLTPNYNALPEEENEPLPMLNSFSSF